MSKTLTDIALDLLAEYEALDQLVISECCDSNKDVALKKLDEKVKAARKEIHEASRHLRAVVPCEDCEYNRFCSQYIDIHGKYYHIDYCSGSEHSGIKK